ncbi:hypothetical protein [Bacillus sp. 165]|uniref:hypothetical protein n=1 Tax=Bacillus sp. 165 TaxID=1529117 RepID=UPI001ADBF6F8|nr:hypothetical protein [Bacillus sp. 165]MBO9129003.1 hypothetical protein [Bacillus sp. 165]
MINKDVAMLVTHSFEINETNEVGQTIQTFTFERGQMYPLVNTCVTLLDNDDGTYKSNPTFLINYEENMPVYVQQSSNIKIINIHEFETELYCTHLEELEREGFHKRGEYENKMKGASLPGNSIEKNEFIIEGNKVTATTKVLYEKLISHIPFHTRIKIIDGKWEKETDSVNISFDLYILNQKNINILFEVKCFYEQANGICEQDCYLEKLKEIIDEYPGLTVEEIQEEQASTNLLLSFTYSEVKEGDTFESVLEWAYGIADDIKKFTDKRVQLSLQES